MINNKLFRGFTFDGVNSLDYDIYITGEGVYNAPVRAVEKVSVPGRNGDLTIDQGRFENIEVTYAECGCAATTQEEFAEKVAAFRNALCSRVGYKRLTDDYNKDEYRMAMYVSGLEVEAIAQHRMGTFDIVFDAKPQRFLYAGESPQLLVQNMTPKNPQTESGSIVSIEGTGTEVVTSIVAQIEPVQSGSGDPSPTNVRAITGWTDAGINISPYEQTEKHTITGKNLYNAPNDQMNVLVPCHIDGNVRVVISETSASISGFRYYDANKQQIGYWTLSSTASDRRRYRAFTTMRACEYVEFYGAQGTDLMVETGVTVPSPYEPYGTHTNVPLGQTVYGGTVDVTTGVLTIGSTILDLGSFTWSRHATYTNCYSVLGNSLPFPAPINVCYDGLCEQYKVWYTGADVPVSVITSASNNGYLFISPSRWSTSNKSIVVNDNRGLSESAFKTAMNGVHLVCPLATPTTVQLTPTQVASLLGTNNVWADTGDITITWGDDPYMLINPTLHASKPLLKVTGRGTLSVGDVTMTITGTASQVLYIDCDIMETYSIQDGAMTPQNSLVTIDGYDYPVLLPGATKVTLGSGITKVEVTPRWWRV